MPYRATTASTPSSLAPELLESRTLFSIAIGLTGRDQLLFFDTDAPQATLSTARVTGLGRGETLLGIDFRPGDGALWALGDSSQLYRIDLATYRATAAGLPLSPGLGVAAGIEWGFDFDPVGGSARVVSTAEVNLRVDPATGGVSSDLALAYANGDIGQGTNPSLTAIAFSNSFPGASSSVLYGIDGERDALVRLNTPANGQLGTVGPLGVDVGLAAGFDIARIETNGIVNDNVAFAAADGFDPAAKGRSTLLSINLATGAAANVGPIGSRNTPPIRDLAIAPQGETIWAIDGRNSVAVINSALPNVATSRKTISGLAKKELVLAIDQLGDGGDVVGFTSNDRLVRIAPGTFAATPIGGQLSFDMSGRSVGMTLDPGTGLLRIVNERGQHIRMNPTTGAVIDAYPLIAGLQTDGALAYGTLDVNVGTAPRVTALAVTDDGATTYGIDGSLGMLVRLGHAGDAASVNTGQLTMVGPLATPPGDPIAFDINGDNAWAAFRGKGRQTQLHRISLATGGATLLGNLGPKNAAFTAFAIIE